MDMTGRPDPSPKTGDAWDIGYAAARGTPDLIVRHLSQSVSQAPLVL